MGVEEVARRLIEAMTSGDFEAEMALYATDAVQHHPMADEPLEGRDAIRESEQLLRDAFTGIDVQERGILSSGSTVAIEMMLKATNTGPLMLGPDQELPATGRRIELPAVWMLEIDDDGLMSEERDYLDTAPLFRQLGLEG